MKPHLSVIITIALILSGCSPEQPPPPQYLVVDELLDFGGNVTIKESDNGKRILGVQLPAIKTTDAQIELLRGLNELQTLDVENSKVTDDGLRHLAQLTELQSLDLHGTQITAKGLKHLIQLQKLHTLDLAGTQVSDDGIESLKQLSHLKSLNLLDTNVTQDGVRELRKALPELDIIDASGNLAKEL